MWLGVKENRYSLRHTCEEGDKLTRYAWVRHDGATYGRQVFALRSCKFFMKDDMPLLENACVVDVLFLMIAFTSAGNSRPRPGYNHIIPEAPRSRKWLWRRLGSSCASGGEATLQRKVLTSVDIRKHDM
jgi:hypothetical protein